MRRIFLYLSIFIILCFFADFAIKYSIAKQINDQSPYCLSFASIGANLLESRLDCWAKIDTVNTFEEMDLELLNILTLLDLPVEEEKFLHQELNGKKTLRYELLQNNQSYLFTLQTESQKSYFMLSTISNQNDQKMREDEKKIQNQLHCQSYFHYQGIVNARLDKAGREKLVQVITKGLKADVQDQYEDENLISVTAYSPQLLSKVHTVQVADKSYNVQLVLRSDETKNQTYIYMGFPLLLNDY